MTSVGTVLFDADGVLQFPKQRWRNAFKELPGLAGDEALDQFSREITRVESLFLERETGFDIAVQDIIRRAGLSFDLDEAIAIFNAIERDEAIIDIVQSLRSAGLRCYLVTNQQASRALHMSKVLYYQNLFDGEFYSCTIGSAKPNLSYFTHVVSAIGKSAGSMLFIDDNPENVSAAATVGIRAELFDRTSGTSVLLDRLARHDVYL